MSWRGCRGVLFGLTALAAGQALSSPRDDYWVQVNMAAPL